MEMGSFMAVFYGASSEENAQELQYGVSPSVYICYSIPMAEEGVSKTSWYRFESYVRHQINMGKRRSKRVALVCKTSTEG